MKLAETGVIREMVKKHGMVAVMESLEFICRIEHQLCYDKTDFVAAKWWTSHEDILSKARKEIKKLYPKAKRKR